MRKFLAIAAISTISFAPMMSADAISKKDVAKQVTMEQVYGPKYGKYYGKYGLNWGHNGCSIPSGAGIPSVQLQAALAAVKVWGGFFKKSCDRHDFGYRNHKVSGYSRSTVDSKLHANMVYQCKHKDWPGPDAVAEKPCLAAAQTIYRAVQIGGWSRW